MNTRSKFSSNQDEEDDEMESQDKIEDLNKKSSKTFEIPKPHKSSSFNTSSKFAPIDFNQYFQQTFIGENKNIPIYMTGNQGPILFCLHGAGHSGLSFATFAGNLKDRFRIISFDFRGHGYNTQDNTNDLSQKTLIQDTIEVLDYVVETFSEENIIVIGHSMGGSIATKTVAHLLTYEAEFPKIAQKIQGLVVIDVVEGTAMEALPFMENIVKSRPKCFKNVESAISYMIKSGTIKNYESARVSVPTLLNEVINIKKEKEYVWKSDLLASKPFWTEWFEGLTSCFLSIKMPKLLLLAASDRMDKELTIAQMQGKFKLSVVGNVGHIMHEDDPKSTAEVVNGFVKTFRIPALFKDIKPIVAKIAGSNAPQKRIDDTKKEG